MIALALSSRDRRFLLVGTTVIIGAVGWMRIGAPLIARGQEATNEVRMARVRHQKAEYARRMLPDLRSSVNVRAGLSTAIDSTVGAAQTNAEAAARFAAAVEETADSAALRVTSIQFRGDTVPHKPFTRIGIHITALGDIEGVGEFLGRLAIASRPIVVRELSVTASDPASPANVPENLRFDLVLETITRISAAR